MRKNKKNQIIPSAIAMKELSYFGSFNSQSLSIDGVDEIERSELRDQIHVLYISILPSRMHLVAITTH